MNRRLPKSFFEKDRPKIKNESKQDIFRIQYPKEVELGKKHIIFTDFIGILILGQFYSNCFSVSDFISINTVFFSYYRRFFYSGKSTTHYRYRFRKITPMVFLKI